MSLTLNLTGGIVPEEQCPVIPFDPFHPDRGPVFDTIGCRPAFSGDIFLTMNNPVSLRPGKLYVRELQFMDILKVILDSVLLQLLQECVHIDRA